MNTVTSTPLQRNNDCQTLERLRILVKEPNVDRRNFNKIKSQFHWDVTSTEDGRFASFNFKADFLRGILDGNGKTEDEVNLYEILRHISVEDRERLQALPKEQIINLLVMTMPPDHGRAGGGRDQMSQLSQRVGNNAEAG